MPAEQARSFPFRAVDPLLPPAEYRELRTTEPVSRITLPTGDPAWLLVRHEDVRAVLADARFSREAITAPGAPRILPIAQGSKSIFVMDPPEHSRLRRLVSRAFSTRAVEGLRPRVEEVTDGLLKTMVAAGPPADLIGAFAQPLPIQVICDILGVPYEDVEQFREWTDIMLTFDRDRATEVLTARQALTGYLTALIEAKRRRPADDLLSVLTAAQDDGDRLTEEELLAFGYTLLGAGYHATTATIVHSVLALLRTRSGWERLRDDPALLPGAVEELLRLSQAGGGVGALRIATTDVRIGDVLIRAGDAVLPSINAGNFDEDVFAGPAAMDLDRRPNPHLAFGYGIHHCLGAQLGRMELAAALGGLLRAVPGLRLAGSEDELAWSGGTAFSRPAALPVVW
ncbi:cytochrome P450 [Actinoplanes sp. N902-109]|uniref:cytochrome P450 n=1 Tax=Actinoplanes sp. (strain N902-109) TaxID=649831 RepID=UPI000329614E|nr:cytochrome P450 [Actinoplanes sp. N902-109]AGL16637.1 putative cytochrome P450 dependend monooxygenase [Actinoplanes sp. N902-109]